MGSKCIAPNCIESTRKKKPDLNFYMFPVNPVRRKQWLRAVNLEAKDFPKNASICSKHFLKSCYDGKSLRKDAVPTVFDRPDMLDLNSLQKRIRNKLNTKPGKTKDVETVPVQSSIPEVLTEDWLEARLEILSENDLTNNSTNVESISSDLIATQFQTNNTDQESSIVPPISSPRLEVSGSPRLEVCGNSIYLLSDMNIEEIIASNETDSENRGTCNHILNESENENQSDESKSTHSENDNSMDSTENMNCNNGKPIAKLEFLEAKRILKTIKKQLKTAQQKNRRLERRVLELKNVLVKLKRTRCARL